jgi:hypothetical protein
MCKNCVKNYGKSLKLLGKTNFSLVVFLNLFLVIGKNLVFKIFLPTVFTQPNKAYLHLRNLKFYGFSTIPTNNTILNI